MEIKQIPNYPEYSADTSGRIYSNRRTMYLKPIIKKGGYLQVNLSVKGKRKCVLIHQLIAETFLDKPKEYGNGFVVINHKDGNKENNSVDNLEYTTLQCNVIHGFKLGLNTNVGYNHPHSLKLSNDTIDEVLRLHNEGFTGAAISRILGFSQDTARRIIKNPQKYYHYEH